MERRTTLALTVAGGAAAVLIGAGAVMALDSDDPTQTVEIQPAAEDVETTTTEAPTTTVMTTVTTAAPTTAAPTTTVQVAPPTTAARQSPPTTTYAIQGSPPQTVHTCTTAMHESACADAGVTP